MTTEIGRLPWILIPCIRWFDARKLDYRTPLLCFVGDELAEIGGRHRRACTGQSIGETRFHLGVDEARIDFRVKLIDDCDRGILGSRDTVPPARLVSSHKLTDRRHFG